MSPARSFTRRRAPPVATPGPAPCSWLLRLRPAAAASSSRVKPYTGGDSRLLYLCQHRHAQEVKSEAAAAMSQHGSLLVPSHSCKTCGCRLRLCAALGTASGSAAAQRPLLLVHTLSPSRPLVLTPQQRSSLSPFPPSLSHPPTTSPPSKPHPPLTWSTWTACRPQHPPPSHGPPPPPPAAPLLLRAGPPGSTAAPQCPVSPAR